MNAQIAGERSAGQLGIHRGHAFVDRAELFPGNTALAVGVRLQKRLIDRPEIIVVGSDADGSGAGFPLCFRAVRHGPLLVGRVCPRAREVVALALGKSRKAERGCHHRGKRQGGH